MRLNSLFPAFLERIKQYFVGIEHVCYHNCTVDRVLNAVLTKKPTLPLNFHYQQAVNVYGKLRTTNSSLCFYGPVVTQ